MSAMGVSALNTAIQTLLDQCEVLTAAGLADSDLRGVITIVEQGRDVLVQNEKDMRVSISSGLAAHKQLLALRTWAADARRTLQELGIRESIALQSHTERVRILNALIARDPEPRAELGSFAVSTDAPRPGVEGA